jgi:hypothetical protein
MIVDQHRLTPILQFGALLLAIAIIGLMVLILGIHDDRMDGFRVFLLVASSMHFITGLGIILKTTWGYYLLLAYLYLMLLGIPIGTYLGLKGLRYVRDPRIKAFFGGRSLCI